MDAAQKYLKGPTPKQEPQSQKTHSPQSPCSLLQKSGVCRDEKSVLGHITTIHLGQVTCPPTSLFPKDKHPQQVNQITSQQSSLSIWNDDRVQSTSWILISTDAMQPTDFPAASLFQISVFIKHASFLVSSFYGRCYTGVTFFFIKPPCLSKMTKIFTLLFMAILWVYVTPMPILWPFKHKDSYSLDSWWVYVVLWKQDNNWIYIV